MERVRPFGDSLDPFLACRFAKHLRYRQTASAEVRRAITTLAWRLNLCLTTQP